MASKDPLKNLHVTDKTQDVDYFGLVQELSSFSWCFLDDITFWSTTGSVGEQEHTLQCGLDAVQSFLEDVGMTASPEKTEYVVVLSGPQHLAD